MKALKNHSHSFVFLFLWIKSVVWDTLGVFLLKKTCFQNLKDISFKSFQEKWFQCILAWMLCSSIFYSSIKYFCASLLFNDIPYQAKLCQRKVTTQSGKNVTQFCFCLSRNLVFMRKCSQSRIYAETTTLKSRVKGPIHIIIPIKRIIHFFIHFFSCSYTCSYTRKTKE